MVARISSDQLQTTIQMKRKIRSFIYDEDGQAVAELALAIPVLLLVLLAIFDFGRAVNYWNDENHVAGIAARYAAVGSTGGTCSGTDYSTAGHTLSAYVACEAGLDSVDLQNGNGTGNGVRGSGVNVCVSAPGATVGSTSSVGMPVTVLVKLQYNFVPFLGNWTSTFNTWVAGQATMRLEQPLAANVTTQAAQCT